MQRALALADQAEALGEVPVGALVVLDHQVIGQGFNSPISDCDPTAHAEMIALRQAAKTINNYRLVDATLYVTLEPCTMCVGAMIHSRIRRLVYGAREPKAGAVESQGQLLQAPYINHHIPYTGGVCGEESAAKLSQFFAKRRQAKRKQAKDKQ